MRKILALISMSALLWACGEKPEPTPEKPVPGNVTGLKCVEDKTTETSLTPSFSAAPAKQYPDLEWEPVFIPTA